MRGATSGAGGAKGKSTPAKSPPGRAAFDSFEDDDPAAAASSETDAETILVTVLPQIQSDFRFVAGIEITLELVKLESADPAKASAAAAGGSRTADGDSLQERVDAMIKLAGECLRTPQTSQGASPATDVPPGLGRVLELAMPGLTPRVSINRDPALPGIPKLPAGMVVLGSPAALACDGGDDVSGAVPDGVSPVWSSTQECRKIAAQLHHDESDGLPSDKVWLPNDLYHGLLQLFAGTSVLLPLIHPGNVGRFLFKLTGSYYPAFGSDPDAEEPVRDPSASTSGAGAAESKEAEDDAPAAASDQGGTAAGQGMYVNKRAVRLLYNDLLFDLSGRSRGHEVRSVGGIFHGPPGSGKTTMARAMVREAGFLVVFDGPASDLNKKYFGETESKLRTMMDAAKLTPGVPVVIFFDEIDSITGSRGGVSAASSSKIDVLSGLLARLGSDGLQNLFVFGTTNRKESIDPAVMRPGRLSTTIYVGRLSVADRLTLLRKQWLDVDLPPWVLDDEDFVEMAEVATQNFTGALVRKAVSNTARLKDRVGGAWAETRKFRDAFEQMAEELTASGNDIDLYPRPRSHDAVNLNAEKRKELVDLICGPDASGRVLVDLSDGIKCRVLG